MKNNSLRLLSAAILTAVSASAFAASTPLNIWVSDSAGKLGKVDVNTGDVTVVGNMGTSMTDIAFDPDGNLWGISFSNLYKINKLTGAATLVGGLGNKGLNSLAFSSTGDLYAMSYYSNKPLYTINVTNAEVTAIGTNSGTRSSGDLAFINNEMYLSSLSGNLQKIDTTTGTATNVGALGAANFYGLATPDNVALYGVAGTSVYSIDAATGAATSPVSFAGKGLGTAWGSAFIAESSEVPLPAAAWLFGSALLGLAAKRKKS